MDFCSKCGSVLDEIIINCPYCGETVTSHNNYNDESTKTDKPEKALLTDEDFIRLIGPKANVYLSKWKNTKNAKPKRSWNWSGFIFNFLWLGYRKMYSSMIIWFAICIGYFWIFNHIDTSPAGKIGIFIALSLWIGLDGNYKYFVQAKHKIIRIKNKYNGLELQGNMISKAGGVSWLGVAMASVTLILLCLLAPIIGVKVEQGTFNLTDGTKYVGVMKNGLADGQGHMFYPNGDEYIGELRNGKSSGRGTYTFADGETQSGEFENGILNGMCTITYTNHDKYIGKFSNNVQIGEGHYVCADGTQVPDYQKELDNLNLCDYYVNVNSRLVYRRHFSEGYADFNEIHEILCENTGYPAIFTDYITTPLLDNERGALQSQKKVSEDSILMASPNGKFDTLKLTKKQTRWCSNEATDMVTGIDKIITTPAGTFQHCIEVTETIEVLGTISKLYYAPKFGLVKKIVKFPKNNDFQLFEELISYS